MRSITILWVICLFLSVTAGATVVASKSGLSASEIAELEAMRAVKKLKFIVKDDFYFGNHDVAPHYKATFGKIRDMMFVRSKMYGYIDMLVQSRSSGKTYRFVHETCWPLDTTSIIPLRAKIKRRVKRDKFITVMQIRSYQPQCNLTRKTYHIKVY